MLKLYCTPHTSYPIPTKPSIYLQEHNKKPVKTLGAGRSLPVVRGILGILKKKQSKPKDLDATRQPSSTVDDRIVMPLHDAGDDGSCKVEGEPALDDNVDTVKVRGGTVCTFVQPKAWP